MLSAAVLTALVCLAGTVATYLYDDSSPILARVAYGAASGLAVFAVVAFALASVLGITAGTVAAAVASTAAIAALSRTRAGGAFRDDVARALASLRSGHWRTLANVGPAVYWVAVVALLWLAFDRVIVASPEGIATGYVNNLGDLPFHMHISASFAYSHNFPPFDPTLVGTGLTYPYMADFVTATFLSLGATMRDAFLVLNVVLGLALVTVIHRLTLELTRNRLAAFIAPALALLSGGVGWLEALADARASERGLVALLWSLPQDYTINGEGYRWGNAITTLLVPQRGMLFGLVVSLLVFLLLWRLVHAPPLRPSAGPAGTRRSSDVDRVRDAIRARPGALAAGLLTGFLPLIHAHSFAVVMATAFLIGVLFRQWREGRWLPWAVFVVSSLAVALPELWWSTRLGGADAGTFLGVHVGWDRGDADPVTFWLRNTGVFIPLTLLPLLVPPLRDRLPRNLVLFSLPFLAWFVLPNVLRLAPWIWDNIKVLYYWYIGLVPLAALVIAMLLRSRIVQRLGGAALLLSLVLAGALDVFRVVSHQAEYAEFEPDGVRIAGEMLRSTPPRSVVLHAPTWNTPAFLTGRQSVIGYPGHMWSRGLDPGTREADVGAIYGGAPDAPVLLERYGVDYILVSPHEQSIANMEFLSQFREVASAGEYRLLEVTP